LKDIIEKLTSENPILEIQVQERVGEFQAWCILLIYFFFSLQILLVATL